VVVKWKRKWYDATILAVEGAGRYRIHYDGWSSSWDETVGPSRIAERGSVSIARKGCGWAMTTLGVLAMVAVGLLVGLGIVVSVCGDSPTVDANGPPVTAETVLGPGDKVHAQWGSSWYMATVLAVAADGTVQVHYDGFDDSSDEYVPRDRLRLIPPAAGP